ncbi:SUF system Fe-S cluster assembly regulator [Povalibacter sp.]|uniref:SUF system Fe-S cluster assembly regulator n=1 Tax=Povalibacter sp. TaxID=1962978 RepID=UPI002F40E289
MLRISKLTDYGTVILALLASQPDCQLAAAEVAERTRIALPTVSKVLKSLQRSGLVMSTRGSHGGYQLAKPASEITAVHILDALEGPFAITECSGEHSSCGIESNCRVGQAWQRVNSAIRRALADVTLAQLAGVERSITTVPLSRITRVTHE